jgi:hypothetical protein
MWIEFFVPFCVYLRHAGLFFTLHLVIVGFRHEHFIYMLDYDVPDYSCGLHLIIVIVLIIMVCYFVCIVYICNKDIYNVMVIYVEFKIRLWLVTSIVCVAL